MGGGCRRSRGEGGRSDRRLGVGRAGGAEDGRGHAGSPWERQVAHLSCLRGIDTPSALGLCAEVGNFERFERPAQLMSYLGLVPSESPSGEKRRQGAIPKSGSRHARRLLVEAAWHYRQAPRKGTELRRRQEGQPRAVLRDLVEGPAAPARSWVRLGAERGKRRTLYAVAEARELAGPRAYQPDRESRTRPTAASWPKKKARVQRAFCGWGLDKRTAISAVVPHHVVHPGLLEGWGC